jgi:hypothetical protein
VGGGAVSGGVLVGVAVFVGGIPVGVFVGVAVAVVVGVGVGVGQQVRPRPIPVPPFSPGVSLAPRWDVPPV